ncbi:MAG: hypothetical protein U9Q27_01550 [Patescibacteria group bacterium]|nr:hypothetical protein [Patescibacteria group bacterium]
MEKERGITITNVEREAAIEDIAWRLFKRRLGLSFNKELTPEEKKPIINDPSFQIYMDEAMKIYEKKTKSIVK